MSNAFGVVFYVNFNPNGFLKILVSRDFLDHSDMKDFLENFTFSFVILHLNIKLFFCFCRRINIKFFFCYSILKSFVLNVENVLLCIPLRTSLVFSWRLFISRAFVTFFVNFDPNGFLKFSYFYHCFLLYTWM